MKREEGNKISNIKDKVLYFLLIPIVVLVCIEAIIRIKKVPAYLIPLPSEILRELIKSRDVFLVHSFVTVKEILLGFLLGILVGTISAISMLYFKPLKKIAIPFILFIKAFPKIALAPLFLIWFGFGLLPKVAMSALMSFFPFMVNLLAGLQNVSKERIELFNSLCAKKIHIFFKLMLPSSLPYIFAGLKTSLVYATTGVIIGEFISSDRGLGYLIFVSAHQLRADVSFAAVAILTGVVFLLYSILDLLERKILNWREVG